MYPQLNCPDMQAQALLEQQIKDAADAKIIYASPFEYTVWDHPEEVEALFQQYGKVSFSFQSSHHTAALADKENEATSCLDNMEKVCPIMVPHHDDLVQVIPSLI